MVMGATMASKKNKKNTLSKTVVNVTVIDETTQETIPLASIVFKAQDGVCSVINANSNGIATTTDLSEGTYEIMVFANGYLQTENNTSKIKSNKNNNLLLGVSSVYEPIKATKKQSKTIVTEF
jgi:hypothetical protein